MSKTSGTTGRAPALPTSVRHRIASNLSSGRATAGFASRVPPLMSNVRPLMHDGQYMFPGELVAVVAFLFAPPLLLALSAQIAVFAKHRSSRRGVVCRAIAGCIATILGSLVIGAATHQFAPKSLDPLLRVREVAIGSQTWPVMPLAFPAVAIAAIFSTWWVLGRNHTEA